MIRLCEFDQSSEEKKEEIWLSPIIKAPTLTEKSKKQHDNTKTPPKTSSTQRLQTDKKEYRLSIKGNEDHGRVASREFWQNLTTWTTSYPRAPLFV